MSEIDEVIKDDKIEQLEANHVWVTGKILKMFQLMYPDDKPGTWQEQTNKVLVGLTKLNLKKAAREL